MGIVQLGHQRSTVRTGGDDTVYCTATRVFQRQYKVVLLENRRYLVDAVKESVDVSLHRTIGNILIAAGALAPAFGGAFSRMGVSSALYIGELIGVLLMFAGFLRATTPIADKAPQSAAQPVS